MNEELLEKFFPKGDFLFEETELSEKLPRAVPLSLDILRKIYGKGGPVNQVYFKYGIKYRAKDFFRVVGNELYIDREVELKNLYPALSLLNEKYEVKFKSLAGALRSALNVWRRSRISLYKYSDLRAMLKMSLRASSNDEADFSKRLNDFLNDYHLIFEIEFLTEIAIDRLNNLLKDEDVSLSEILGSAFESDYLEAMHFSGEGLKGNNLDLRDESEFIVAEAVEELTDGVKKWYLSLNDLERKRFLPRCLQTQRWLRLKEQSRWLLVKHVNLLRQALPDEEDICFGSLEELLNGKIGKGILEDRRKEFDRFSEYDFPARLSRRRVVDKLEILALAPGSVIGKLQPASEVKKGDVAYCKTLDLELEPLLKEVVAIVSETGGLTSQLANLARKAGVAVVTNVNEEKLKQLEISFGDKVKVDGNNGKLLLIDY